MLLIYFTEVIAERVYAFVSSLKHFTIMGEWKWVFVKGCECDVPISTTVQILKLCQDGEDASACSGIGLCGENDTSMT